MSASLMVTWASAMRGLYKIIDHCLCCALSDNDGKLYFAIYRKETNEGRLLRTIIHDLYKLAEEAGLPGLQFKGIDEYFLKDLQLVSGYAVTSETRDEDSEYVYAPRDIFDMYGTINKEKRRGLKKCSEFTDISLRPITKENAGLIMFVEAEWCRSRDCAICASYLGCERKALEQMVNIFDENIHCGLLLYRGERPVGYAVGEMRDSQLALLHYGKALLPDFFLYLIYGMTERYFKNALYINLAEDMGNHGIRLFKRHLGNHILWRHYRCSFIKPGDNQR
jgi:hypothetical protein